MSLKRQEPETTAVYLLGAQWAQGAPPWGPWAPRGGPWPHTHFGVPASARTISDGRVGTTIRMAKEMWFLRLLLEWPGFPTLSYSVVQCTAAVSLRGECFFAGLLFWEHIIFFNNFHIFSKLLPSRRRGSIAETFKTLVFWPIRQDCVHLLLNDY